MKTGSIIGTGIDIVENAPIARARFKDRLAEYFLTKEEIAAMPPSAKSIEFLASRFAAKEAVIKAFPEKLSPHDFRIEKAGEKPVVAFVSERHASYSVHVSLSHTPHFAAAVAIVLHAPATEHN
jgi:holo-[acyl-carrier protein] synthase